MARKEKATSPQEGPWLKRIKENPEDRALRMAYSDWLEERGLVLEAFRQRQKAGMGFVSCRLRKKGTDQWVFSYRQKGWLRERMKKFTQLKDGEEWLPDWLFGGPTRVSEAEVVWVWTPAAVLICVEELPGEVSAGPG